MYEGVTAVIEAKPTELPVQSSYFQAEVEIDGKQYAMKWDDKRHVFYYETKLTKGLIRGKVHMNIKGFTDRRKNLKSKQLKSLNYHFKLSRKIIKKK